MQALPQKQLLNRRRILRASEGIAGALVTLRLVLSGLPMSLILAACVSMSTCCNACCPMPRQCAHAHKLMLLEAESLQDAVLGVCDAVVMLISWHSVLKILALSLESCVLDKKRNFKHLRDQPDAVVKLQLHPAVWYKDKGGKVRSTASIAGTRPST